MKRFLVALLCLLISVLPARAEKGVVLALSGGGLKGYAHIGMLQELEKAGIRPVGIVGTSIGSIIGGLYASGYSADELEGIARTMNMTALITDEPDSSLSRPLTGQTTPMGGFRPEIYLDKQGRLVGPLGLFSANRLMNFLNTLTSRHPEQDFGQLPIPFAAVATDLVSGEKVVLTQGSLAAAMRASMSLPGLFDPWEENGRLLVDGGLVSNLPVQTAKQLFPGYPVLAVDVSSDLYDRQALSAMTDVLSQTVTLMTRQNVAAEAKLADFYLPLHVPEYSMLSNPPVEEIIELGRRRTREALGKIKALAKDVRILRTDQPVQGRIRSVILRGLGDKNDALFSRSLNARWQGKDYDVTKLTAVVDSLRSRDDVKYVNMRVSRDGDDLDVTFDVAKYPSHRVGLSFFANTLSRRGWVNISDYSTDLFTDGDVLRLRAWLSDDWALQATYQGADTSESPWISTVTASRFHMDSISVPDGALNQVKWYRYGLAGGKTFALSPWFNLTLGLQADFLHYRGKADGSELNWQFWWAPMLRVSVAWQNHSNDPNWGIGLEGTLLFPPKLDRFVGQAVVHTGAKLGQDWRLELTGGVARGDQRSAYWAAYLGLKGEMYSLLQHPVCSDRFVWGRISLGRVLTSTALGDVDLQLFYGRAKVWDYKGRSFVPWETGVLLTAPKKLMNAQVFAVYNQDREWRFGITVGQSDLEPYLPF